MKKFAITLLLAVTAVPALQAQITWDGIYNSVNDAYTSSESVTWYNGHGTKNSYYNPDTTTIRYATYGGYFYLYAEVPLYAKNMVWADDLSLIDPAVVDSYRQGEDNLHQDPGRFDKLDFGTATGSEKLVFDGITADLADSSGNVKDSYDYLLANSLFGVGMNSTDNTTSLNYDVPMAFEFRFDAS